MSTDSPTPKKAKCGIIMPISSIDGLSEAHWLEVGNILADAIEKAGFEPNLVSSAEDVGIIQKTIIQNLYDNPVVVCDVSGKNPNVMFELGMRLAFDKPTIIVKDDNTTYSFDTSPIEHLNYPRDLRFSQIVDFKNKLTDKVRSTYDKASSDPNYTTFLKNFGEFRVAKIDQTEVPGQEFILEELKNLRQLVLRLDSSSTRLRPRYQSQLLEKFEGEDIDGITFVADFGGPNFVSERDRFSREMAAKFPEFHLRALGERVYIVAPWKTSPDRISEFASFARSLVESIKLRHISEMSVE